MAEKGSWLHVLKHTWSDFGADHCSQLAAALAYYTIFSIPALAMLALLFLGMFVSPATVQHTIQQQAAGSMGPQGASFLQTVMQDAQRPHMGSVWVEVIAFASLAFSAVGFFLSLQSALNRAWDVAPDPKLSFVKNFLLQRLTGFVTMVVIAIVLLASFVAATLASPLGAYVVGVLPGPLSGIASQAITFVGSLVIITVLFALLFKLLPDATLEWRDAWIGGFVTALLFTIGKLLIGIYLGQSHPGTAFGAGGSIILVLLWIYYSSLILLLGTEFTQAYAVERGGGLRPKEHAVRIVETQAPNRLANRPDSASAPEHAVPEEKARGDEGRAAD